MKLIIGLGNPDQKYQKTRHNLGFIVIEKLREYFSENYTSNEVEKFSDFTFDKNSSAKISKGKINNETILLVIPQTYMNNSGFTAQKLVQFYKLDPEKNILIIYDDIDLPLGEIRTTGESSGGHHGMQSIIDFLGTNKIPRLRCGILSRPKTEIPDTSNFVLQNFEKKELEQFFTDALPKIILKIKKFLDKKTPQRKRSRCHIDTLKERLL